MNKNLIIAGSVLVLIAAGGVVYLWNVRTHDVVSISDNDLKEGSNPPPNPLPARPAGGPYSKGGGEGEGTISPPSIPDLSRPIKITANLPEVTKEDAIEKINKISSQLRENSDSFGDWINLGLYRKLIGDYAGAGEAWQYASVLRPQNSTSFHNLGDLYTYYLKDPKKAEANYLTAIKNDPAFIMAYEKLSEFYRYVLKDDSKAKAILEKGIAKNPDNSERLKYLLNEFLQ